MDLGFSLSLDLTTITFVKSPTMFVLYLTLILDFSPGSIGWLGNSGTTHPHEEKADVINNGSEPAFTKKKLCSPFEFLAMVSKLNLFSSKEIMGPLSS